MTICCTGGQQGVLDAFGPGQAQHGGLVTAQLAGSNADLGLSDRTAQSRLHFPRSLTSAFPYSVLWFSGLDVRGSLPHFVAKGTKGSNPQTTNPNYMLMKLIAANFLSDREKKARCQWLYLKKRTDMITPGPLRHHQHEQLPSTSGGSPGNVQMFAEPFSDCSIFNSAACLPLY